MVGAGACLVVREVVPSIAVRAVVLSNGAPLALTQIRTPLFPRDPFFGALQQPFAFGCSGGWHSRITTFQWAVRVKIPSGADAALQVGRDALFRTHVPERG
jgi:hypothetical protein